MKNLTSLLLCFFILPGVHAQIISTIAGNGIKGYGGDGGPATAAMLNQNKGIAFDNKGNVYFVDNYGVIRKIATSGIIATVAGGAPMGSGGAIGDGGPATASYLYEPAGVAVDGSGNIYIADNYNSRIRKVDTAGIITTIAGGGSLWPGDGGLATAASLGGLFGVAVDVSGNIYFTSGPKVRKVDVSGIITTFAGTGTVGYSGDGGAATNANLFDAYGITTDGAGNVYFTDDVYNSVRKVSTTGIITTVAGKGVPTGAFSGDGGPATNADLRQPFSVTADVYGNIYIGDVANARIRKVNTAGMISTVAGTGIPLFTGDGLPATATQMSVAGVAVDCGGNLYISDGGNNRVRKATYIHSPAFVSEGSMLTVCENSAATSVDGLLAASDADTAQLLSWSVSVPPTHGTAGGFTYSMLTTGGSITPSGLTYKPAAGYIGSDSFTVIVGYCGYLSDTVTIYVTINPLPVVSAITGNNSVCTGHVVTLSDATPGGAWSIAATGVASVNAAGTVTGITAGAATVSYTVTSLGCSTSVEFPVSVTVCPAGVATQSGKAVMSIHPNPGKGTFRLFVPTAIEESAIVTITNSAGTKVKEFTISTNTEKEIITNLPAGVYWLSVQTSEQRYVQQVVVE